MQMVRKNDNGICGKGPSRRDMGEGLFQALKIGRLGQYRLTVVCAEREEVASPLFICAPVIAHLEVICYPIDGGSVRLPGLVDGGSASLDPPYIFMMAAIVISDADDIVSDMQGIRHHNAVSTPHDPLRLLYRQPVG